MGFRDVPRQELVERTAKALEKVEAVSPPSWAKFVKTGHHKERPPTRNDWWRVRAASVLAKLADHSPVGVQKLRTWYGGKKNRGVKPERFYKASGNILRKILQQLEKAGFAKKVEKGLRKGRAITPQGLGFLDKISGEIMKEMNIVLPKKPEGELPVKEEKPKKRKRAPPKKRAPKKKAVTKTEEKPKTPEEKTEAEKPAETEKKTPEQNRAESSASQGEQ